MKTEIMSLSSRSRAAVEAASSRQFALVYSALAAAFEADPVARWVFPTDRSYRTLFPRFVHAFAGRAFEHGRASISGDGHAAALWLAPGVEPDADEVGGLLERHLDPAHFVEVCALMESMDENHPTEVHWYLALLGTRPDFQGSGLGAALLDEQLARCDREGFPAYLESSNARNLGLYRRHGFEVTGEIQVGTSPRLWTLLRDPR